MDADLYLRVREKEGRLYSDDLVMSMPSITRGHILENEWRARSASASRLTRYLARRHKPLSILDLGCGNGWLSNLLAQSGHHVVGADPNRYELTQATRLFSSNSNPCFIQADIFSAPFPFEMFDVVVLASVIQYFPDPATLFLLLQNYLKPRGEIHILDSPFYSDAIVDAAVHRSRQYYASLGFPEMAEHYFHHRFSDLKNLAPKTLYHPHLLALHLKRLLGWVDSPFPWLVIEKQDEVFVP